MTTTVAIDIPREILHAARISPAEVRRELAVALYAQGRLSLGKARELAGMTYWQFQQLLASREIPPHYDLEDYQQDLQMLHDTGRL